MRNRILAAAQGLALAISSLAIASVVQGQTYKYSVLYSFKNNGTAPRNLYAPLILDSAGNLYGTSNNGGKYGLGTVFEVAKSGTLTVLHSFQGGITDGTNPQDSVIRDSAGNLYGTTEYGGDHRAGVVFKLSPSNQETILFSGFDANGPNGGIPNGLIRDSAGNLFGTTLQGGLGGYYYGVAFKLDPVDNFTVLHDFCAAGPPDCPDGSKPGSLITTRGNFYGVTEYGGDLGFGTVFEITPRGVVTVLHTFGGAGDGQTPTRSLRQDAKGNLYGVTFAGGTNNDGILFKQPESGGPETVLYNFGSLPNCADGCGPIGPIAMDRTGNIYGIAYTNTPHGPDHAVVWEVNTAGKETIVHSFATTVEVFASVIIDSAGNLYGVTTTGGRANLGMVYKLTLEK
jgi:uncharacterized repeat protein (TIGR03803 family)